MSEKFITIKEVALNNNCPECFSKDGLRLTFKQKFLDTKFYKSITADVSHSIACKTCNSTIYPVQWTDDIERVFEYHQRAFEPKKASTYLKKLSWIAILFIAVVIAGIVFTVLYAKL
ncbi:MULTISPECIES: hypothetical protein [Hwangdonia]|uniref:Uncharacterized protein n=1 Tax=Hwangdonia seohaensis TaxID=1240727 RepID=A0ABW3R8R3_9FLAO|nr:hypothetical protein [Hwangdonia seohaensis]